MVKAMTFQDEILQGIPDHLPAERPYETDVSHAPVRDISGLSIKEKRLAVQNALRYFPKEYHEKLAAEFAAELEQYGAHLHAPLQACQ
jgi:urocanate hydratase